MPLALSATDYGRWSATDAATGVLLRDAATGVPPRSTRHELPTRWPQTTSLISIFVTLWVGLLDRTGVLTELEVPSATPFAGASQPKLRLSHHSLPLACSLFTSDAPPATPRPLQPLQIRRLACAALLHHRRLLSSALARCRCPAPTPPPPSTAGSRSPLRRCPS